jgi:hypothetical protein
MYSESVSYYLMTGTNSRTEGKSVSYVKKIPICRKVPVCIGHNIIHLLYKNISFNGELLFFHFRLFI